MDQQVFELPKPEKRFRYSLTQTIIWGIIVLIGLLFLTEKWPGRVFILCVSTGGFFGYNFCAWLLLRGRNMINNIIMVLFILWLLIVAIGILWLDERPITIKGLPILGIVFVVVTGINALVFRKYFTRMQA